MSDQTSDRIELGSAEIPAVLPTLAKVLPKFAGEALESQLQTFDAFLQILSPSTRPQIAQLLREASVQASTPEVRARIGTAAESVAQGGRAAEAYDHAKAMRDYQQSLAKASPAASATEPPKEIISPSFSSDVNSPKRRHPQILAQLDRIEAEMKRIGFWSDRPPDLLAAVKRGEIRNYLDAPSFELWLQALFLPQARQAVLEDKLPGGSQVGEMARRQYDYLSVTPEAEALLRLLRQFDELVIQANQGLG